MYEIAGLAAVSESVETALFWGNFPFLQQEGMKFSSAIADAGASPTTAIRAGLLLGQLTTGGELEEWDADATDGSQDLIGVNAAEFSTLNVLATAVDKYPPQPIVRGAIRAASLLIQGTAFTSHADEFVARNRLHNMGIVLDDDPQGWLAGVNWREDVHTGDKTLVEADNATRYICHSADADFILPTIKQGLQFEFFMGEDFELQISSPASNFLVGHDQTADGVTFTTAGEQIGVNLHVEAINMDIAGTNTLTWIMTRKVTAFSTDDYFALTIDT